MRRYGERYGEKEGEVRGWGGVGLVIPFSDVETMSLNGAKALHCIVPC